MASPSRPGQDPASAQEVTVLQLQCTARADRKRAGEQQERHDTTSHFKVDFSVLTHGTPLSPGDNTNGPLASEVWVQPLEGRQIGERMQKGQEETFEVHTGMKNLWFFLLPLKAPTT